MEVLRGVYHPGIANACGLTIGNRDVILRGPPAMIALLCPEVQHRGWATCMLTIEPHPRDFFACRTANPELSSLPAARMAM